MGARPRAARRDGRSRPSSAHSDSVAQNPHGGDTVARGRKLHAASTFVRPHLPVLRDRSVREARTTRWVHGGLSDPRPQGITLSSLRPHGDFRLAAACRPGLVGPLNRLRPWTLMPVYRLILPALSWGPPDVATTRRLAVRLVPRVEIGTVDPRI